MSHDPMKFGGLRAELRLIAGCARNVWGLIPRSHRVKLGAALGLVALLAACNTGFAILTGRLFNGIQPTEGVTADAALRAAAVTLAMLAGLYLVREALNLSRRYLVESSCTRLEQEICVKAIGSLIRADLASLGQDKIGAIQGRISRSAVGTVRFVRLTMLDLLPPVLTGFFAVATVLSRQPLLALFMLGIVPVSVFLTLRQIASQKGVRLQLIRGREQIDGTVVELLGGIDYVRAANTEDHELRRVGDAARHLRETETRHHFEMALFGSGRALVEGFFHILVLGTACYLAANGQIKPGEVLTFSLLFAMVMAPLNEVHRALDEGHECSLRVQDLLAMIRQPADPSYAPANAQSPTVVTDGPLLCVDDLVVEYRTLAGPKRALDGISLRLRHGEVIGLAGPSGCGKSTLLKVLLRLTHPTTGSVRVGGVPVDAVSRADLGKLIGYVGQNPFVFHGTIAENVAYGCGDAAPTMEQIVDAARRANIHDEILAMPGGYQASVAERGANLSGGQRQRLALARVFLKDPPVLILDEGTSALDTISERKIQAAIDLARTDRTVILVAHRLSTLRDADRIYVFRDGRIIQEGSFAQLNAATEGIFAEMVRSSDMVEPELVAAH